MRLAESRSNVIGSPLTATIDVARLEAGRARRARPAIDRRTMRVHVGQHADVADLEAALSVARPA